MQPTVVGAHGGEITEHAVAGQEQYAPRQGGLERQQHVVAVDDHMGAAQTARVDPFQRPPRAIGIAGGASLYGLALSVAQRVPVPDELQGGTSGVAALE